MTTQKAEMVCYIQPVTAQAAGMAWVDTGKTAVIRRTVSSKRDALQLIEDARSTARALGGKIAIKTIVQASYGARRPAGVKAMQGTEVVQ